jgi:hypothetical protein
MVATSGLRATLELGTARPAAGAVVDARDRAFLAFHGVGDPIGRLLREMPGRKLARAPPES